MTEHTALAVSNRGTVWALAVGWLPSTTATRMLAPLLGIIATGLDITLVTAGVVFAVFELSGLVGPAAGWITDRFGPRISVLIGLGGVVVGAAACAVAPSVVTFGIGLVVLGLAANLYEPGALAWISSVSSFAERSAWSGRFELAWPGGMLIGLPVAGVLSLWTWRAAFAVVAALAAVMFVVLVRRLGEVAPDADRHGDTSTPWDWATIRSGIPLFAGYALLFLASSLLIVVFGVWLEDRFGYSAAAIAAVGFAFGLGDLLAGLLTIRISDRLGKVRSMAAGTVVLVAASAGLSQVEQTAVLAIPLLGVALVGFEFALLSGKTLLTEVDPANRGLGLGLGFGTGAATRSIGAIVATATYTGQGFGGVAALAALCGVVTVVVFAVFVREPR